MNRFNRKNDDGKLALGIVLAFAIAFSVSLPLISSVPQSQVQGPNIVPGQASVLLPDGRRLLVGGESAGGAGLNIISVWDPQIGRTLEIPAKLQHGRAWHTATLLPDGTVLILGGVGADRQIVGVPELFDPRTQSLSVLAETGLTGRARHTATLLTDGNVLVAGGVDGQGETLNTTEVWNFFEPDSAVVHGGPLTVSRRDHSASLLADGNVLLRGGADEHGRPLPDGDRFDPATRGFQFIDRADLPIVLLRENPLLVASLPLHQAVDVPLDAVIALRFSKSLRVQSLNIDTITLSGPRGVERVGVVPAEDGMLAYVTSEADLLPGSTYSLTVNGAVDRDGLLLPASGISFSTLSLAGSAPGSDRAAGTGLRVTEDSERRRDDDDREWRGRRREDGKPRSDWEDLPPLRAPARVTALAGQVLDVRGRPLANVILTAERHYGSGAQTARTDETGRFLIQKAEAGWNELLIDGRAGRVRLDRQSQALGPREDHGVFKYGLMIEEGQTNVLPFTIWLPKIDKAHAVRIPSPTTAEVIVRNPTIPGLELRIAPGTAIQDIKGEVVREVSLTPIPLDRTPFPLTTNIDVPLYFTAQPGGAYVYNSGGGVGARIIYPNHTVELPGARFNFWHYDPRTPRGWYIYGEGTVTGDGKQVVPDPEVSFYEFTGAMFGGPNPGPAGPPPCPPGQKCEDGDPVNLATGTFVAKKTDFYIPDVMPIQLTRTYRQGDTNNRPFGIGTTHPYNMFFNSTNQWHEVNLILPDGGRVYYTCIQGANCSHWTTAQLEHTATQTKWYKSKITWNGNGWNITLKDGTVYVMGDNAPLKAIRDRNGNQITISRPTPSGNITRITSPTGRWIDFTYGTGNRVSQVKDNLGRTVTYTYDGSGRLWKVTDPDNGVTEYTYGTSHRMLTIKDARGIVFLTNEYDATTGRVTKQTLADTGVYEFSYTTDGGKIVQTDVTDPRNYVRRVAFNADGQIISDTRALGTSEEQVTTYDLQTGTNLALSITDPLNRTMAYTYDSMGNRTSVTRLSGTGNAVTTTYTYEPAFNKLASITDPLNHITAFGYDSFGNLTSITNPLNQTTMIARNASGQPISVTDPLNNTTQFTYDFGDLSSVINPLGNIQARFTDLAGRVIGQRDPLGQSSIYDYDLLNRLTKVIDPLAGETAFGYDANGNLLSVTDARSNQTTYTYNSMDRLATRVDPLTRSESYQYDLNGNMTQFTDRKSQVTSYTYDGINRRTGVAYADSSTTAYTYDKGNRLTQVVDSIAGTITRTYDGLDRLTSETTPQGAVSYTYDDADRRTSMTVAGQTTVNYSYDNANRLTQITQGASTTTYTYDAAGRRTSLTLPNDVLVEYAYDNASRLTEITYKQDGTTLLGNLTYEYDKNGNRIKTGGSFARTGLPQAVSSTAYNAANHQTTFGDKTLTYDNNGNLTSVTDGNGTTTYTWNARNQLTGISGPGVSATFVYDGLGRREKKTINSNVTEFLYDGLNPVQETSGSTILANILPGLDVDEFLSRTDGPTGITSHFFSDILGSAVALANATGAVQTEYMYEPFGTTTVTGASNASSYQYTARENDGTGLYHYRARYYNPTLQRFISEDPIEFAAGDVNLYVYVWNNPLTYVDPSGLSGFAGYRMPKYAPRNRVGNPSRSGRPPDNPGPVKGNTPRPETRPANQGDGNQPPNQFRDRLPWHNPNSPDNLWCIPGATFPGCGGGVVLPMPLPSSGRKDPEPDIPDHPVCKAAPELCGDPRA